MILGKFIDLTGQKFGRLEVMERAENDNKNRAKWRCLCECGVTKILPSAYLRSGDTQSCGCYNKDKLKETNTKHGGHGSPEYKSWRNMIDRCTNKKIWQYEFYGARGIKICDRWSSFAYFIDDMGKKPSKEHSIDRIDVNGNYEPSNCRWATKTEQVINQRIAKSNKTGHKGVFKYNSKKWVASITINKKTINLGSFKTLEGAINSRKEAELKYWGKSS